jgi:hypothetical protein
MKLLYRGYMILYHPSDDWLAFIYPPEATEAMEEATRATRKEGEQVLLSRVRARVDEEVNLKKTPRCSGVGL